MQHPLRLTLNSGGAVEALAFSPEGARLAQTVGNNVVVRDSTTGFTLSTLNAHSDYVRAVSWSPCGKWLASGGDDKMVYIYDAQTFEVKCPVKVDAGFGGVQCVTFNGTGDTIVAGCYNGNIFFINTTTSQVREPPLNGHRYALFLFFEY